MSTANMHKNLVKFDCAVFKLCDKQTNRQTKPIYSSQYYAPFPGVK